MDEHEKKTAKSTITINQAYLNGMFKCFRLNHSAVRIVKVVIYICIFLAFSEDNKHNRNIYHTIPH